MDPPFTGMKTTEDDGNPGWLPALAGWNTLAGARSRLNVAA